MTNKNSLPPTQTTAGSDEYLIDSSAATHSLQEILRAKISTNGPVSFREFMASALYHPQYGYYTKGAQNVGKRGDFFTSVSVGPLFGALLAERFYAHWIQSGKPDTWAITEVGANDGTLANDILRALQQQHPEALAHLQYRIAEPLDALRQSQETTLAHWRDHVNWYSSPDELAAHPLPGVIFGNELIDALPFECIEWQKNHWLERRVTSQKDGSFQWINTEIKDPELLSLIQHLGTQFPDGYQTEIRPHLKSFLTPFVQSLEPTQGLMVWLDYGFERIDYYHPDRTRGTLRTFHQHRAGEDPLSLLGQMDITAHVDFTALSEALSALGATVKSLKNQGSWLTHLAKPWLLSQENQPNIKGLRQFQTLTHPSQLGAKFQVLESHH